MSTGVGIGDLLAVADVGAVWANAGEGARATGSVTGKRRGEMAEAKFLAKASELGFGVAKPWGDSDAYDFIVQTSGRLWKVQVKSAHVGREIVADGTQDLRPGLDLCRPSGAWQITVNVLPGGQECPRVGIVELRSTGQPRAAVPTCS